MQLRSLDEPMNEQEQHEVVDDLMLGLGEHVDAIEARELVTAKSRRQSRRDEAAAVARWGADA